MSKKIDEQLKTTAAFIFAKSIHGLNTRESARFASLFNSDTDFVEMSRMGSLTRKYLTVCREPDLRAMGGILDTRSKIVMAYEKQRKAFLKIKQMRIANSKRVDDITFETSFDCNASRELGCRCHLLQEILRFI